MKIKALRIKAFGKFNDRTISLKPGFNIIYGENEAGKTTMQAFIQGMFFGFFKPYRKKKTYSDDYEKYMPWAQFDYSGSLVYELDGEELRLERNFLRGKDSLTIFDNATGSELTPGYKYDGVIRQHLPLGHLGITPGIYNQTVNLKQTGYDFDPASSEEIRDSYLEFLNAGNLDLNLSKVARNLEERKKSVGRAGQSKSKIGLIIRKRDELKETLKEAQQAYQKVAANQEKITKLSKRLKKVETENEYLIQETEVRHKRELLKSYEKITQLEKENQAINERLEVLGDKESYNQETLENLRATQAQIDRLEDQIKYIQKEIDDLTEQLKVIRGRVEGKKKVLEGNNWDMIHADNELFGAQRTEKEEAIQKKNVLISTASIVVTFLGLLVIWLNVMGFSPISGMDAALALVIGTVLMVLGVAGSAYGIVNAFQLRKNRFEIQLTMDQEEILKKYDFESGQEFEDFYKKASRTQRELEQLFNEKELLSVQLSRHQAGFEVLFEQSRGIKRELDKKFEQYGVESVENYAENCLIAREIKELKETLTNNVETIENLRESVTESEEQRISNTWNKTNPKADELLMIGKEIARLEGENAALTEGVDLPVEIAETIESLDTQIASYNREIAACDSALKVLSRMQRESHRESAPELNDSIGEVLETLTGRYKGVKIDEAMQVKVVDPTGGDFKEADQLSAGTMDQVHFAFRFGMGNLITREMPFIMDEPFVRYDKKRKTQALKLLAKLSAQKQIILFTCGNEEERILTELGQMYHRIEL
jgi:uncharacterized protein YhaN